MSNVSLEQLHDIVLPPTPGIWPLAIGWWILIILMLIGTVLLIKKIIYYFQHSKIKRLAIIKLQSCTDCNEINQLLKQVAIHYYHDSNIASLTGTAWIDFIDDNLTTSAKSALTDINNALYTPRHVDYFPSYKTIAMQWLSNLNTRALFNKNVEMNDANL